MHNVHEEEVAIITPRPACCPARAGDVFPEAKQRDGGGGTATMKECKTPPQRHSRFIRDDDATLS